MTTATKTLEVLHTEAAARLQSLNLPADLINDESGQTSAEEHLTWLTTATDEEITAWAKGMGEDA
jgi:hypothetical protein